MRDVELKFDYRPESNEASSCADTWGKCVIENSKCRGLKEAHPGGFGKQHEGQCSSVWLIILNDLSDSWVNLVCVSCHVCGLRWRIHSWK